MSPPKAASHSKQYLTTVKVGTKGQIVLPKEIRQIFTISPGDSLLIRAIASHGIAVQPYSLVSDIVAELFDSAPLDGQKE